MKGKEKCKALKEIRRQIAEENDIPFAVSQCTHKGDCKGTCPKCEAELKYLERELAIRQGLGKAVAVVGVSMGVCSSLSACSPVDTVKNFIENIGYEELAGDVQPVDPTDYDIQGVETEAPDPLPNGEDILGGLETMPPDEELSGEVVPVEGLLPEESEDPTSETAVTELAGDIAPIE